MAQMDMEAGTCGPFANSYPVIALYSDVLRSLWLSFTFHE